MGLRPTDSSKRLIDTTYPTLNTIKPGRRWGTQIHCRVRKAKGCATSCAATAYCFTAIAEISIFASPISPATFTVARAGLGLGISRL